MVILKNGNVATSISALEGPFSISVSLKTSKSLNSLEFVSFSGVSLQLQDALLDVSEILVLLGDSGISDISLKCLSVEGSPCLEDSNKVLRHDFSFEIFYGVSFETTLFFKV